MMKKKTNKTGFPYQIPFSKHKRHRFRLDKEKTGQYDTTTTRLTRNGKSYSVLKMEKIKVTVTPLARNPDRVSLHDSGTLDGLRVFYYRSNKGRNKDHVLISSASGFVSIHANMVTPTIKALKKYRRWIWDHPQQEPPTSKLTNYKDRVGKV